MEMNTSCFLLFRRFMKSGPESLLALTPLYSLSVSVSHFISNKKVVRVLQIITLLKVNSILVGKGVV